MFLGGFAGTPNDTGSSVVIYLHAIIIALEFLSVFHPQDAEKLSAYDSWWERYRQGRVTMHISPVALDDSASARGSVEPNPSQEVRTLTNILRELASQGGEAALTRLLDTAVFRFREDLGYEQLRDRDLQPWRVRHLAVSALETLRRPQDLTWLRERLTDPNTEDNRREVLARVLGTCHDPKSIYPLSTLTQDDSPSVRLSAAIGLGNLEDPKAIHGLASLLEDSSLDVKLAAIMGLERLANETSLAQSSRSTINNAATIALRDESWAIRLIGARLLSNSQDPTPIPSLIDALSREQDSPELQSHERVRRVVQSSLESLTGVYFPPEKPEGWLEWWNEVVDFKIPENLDRPKPRTKAPSFFNLSLDSNHVTFLIDGSESMAERLFSNSESDSSHPKLSPRTKWERTLQELDRAIESLGEGGSLRVILFRDKTVEWNSARKQTNAQVRWEIGLWLSKQKPSGSTHLFDGIQSAFNQPGAEARPLGNFIGSDTLVILSDGSATKGAVAEPSEILRIVSEFVRHAPLRIHCVSIGTEPSELLRRLSETTSGTYRWLRE